jgi:hypothetical protein
LASARKWVTDHAGRKFWIVFYVGLTAGFFAGGWLLQHQAFPPLVAPGQVYVLAFEQNPHADLRLSVAVYPKNPADDTVTATITHGNPERWFIVVDCANTWDAGGRAPGDGELDTFGASVTEPRHPVNVLFQPASRKAYRLGCFPTHSSSAYSIVDVTLPAIGVNDAMSQVPGETPQVYRSGRTLAEFFHGALCATQDAPIRTPVNPGQLPASRSTGASPRPDASVARKAPERAAPKVAASAPGTGRPRPHPVPSHTVPSHPVPSQSAPTAPGCVLRAQWPGKSFSEYTLPDVLQTSESITEADFRNYIFESDYPTATYPRTGSITWNGGSVLEPSLHVADPASDRTVNLDIFYSGVLFGLAGATGVAAIDQLERWVEDHALERAEERAQQPGPAHSPAPELAQPELAQPEPPQPEPPQPEPPQPEPLSEPDESKPPAETPPGGHPRSRPGRLGQLAKAASDRRRARTVRAIQRWQAAHRGR